MKNILLYFMSFLCLGVSLSAALPPLYENIAELKMIINDQKLGTLLSSGESILEISKVNDGYLIKTNHSQVLAKVIYEKMDRPGPAKFHIEFEKAE